MFAVLDSEPIEVIVDPTELTMLFTMMMRLPTVTDSGFSMHSWKMWGSQAKWLNTKACAEQIEPSLFGQNRVQSRSSSTERLKLHRTQVSTQHTLYPHKKY